MLQTAEHSPRTEDQLGRPAIQQLLASRFLHAAQWIELKELAQDLRRLNWSWISLAKKHPELFAEDFIRSRRAENAVYGALIAQLNQQCFPWRNQPPKVYTRSLRYYDAIILGRNRDKASEDAA
jgi:hypothetical protein